MADFGEQVGSDITYFVVPQRGKTTYAARETMLNGELGPTVAVRGGVGWEPTISQDYCVTESAFVQGQAKL